MDMNTFDRSRFNWMKPNPRPSKTLSLSIMADHMVRLNTLLNQKMMRETECRFFVPFFLAGREDRFFWSPAAKKGMIR